MSPPSVLSGTNYVLRVSTFVPLPENPPTLHLVDISAQRHLLRPPRPSSCIPDSLPLLHPWRLCLPPGQSTALTAAPPLPLTPELVQGEEL